MAELTPINPEETPQPAPEIVPSEAPQAASESVSESVAQEPPASGRPPLLGIVLLIAVLGLAAYIGTNVLTVLYAVIAPPSPPTPPNMSQISHTSEAYGVDVWKYTSTDGGCTLVQYIQQHGGLCALAPLACTPHQEVDPSLAVDNSVVARCYGQIPFSIFNEQYTDYVMNTPANKGTLEIDREVYWIGNGPLQFSESTEQPQQ